MRPFLRRFLMHYGIYRRYPLGVSIFRRVGTPISFHTLALCHVVG